VICPTVTVAPSCSRTLSQFQLAKPAISLPSRTRLKPLTVQVNCLPVGGIEWLQGAPGGAAKLSQVCAVDGGMERDQILFCDQGVELDPNIGEGAAELAELGLVAGSGDEPARMRRAVCEVLGADDLVEDIVVAPVDRFEVPADEGLVLVLHRDLSCGHGRASQRETILVGRSPSAVCR
jgi:hypothetical protein